jgi:AcrR family transcriptional regulator
VYTERESTLADESARVNIGEQICSQNNEMARTYESKARAERKEATRQRIVDATVELHEEIGPARTSISAIAERAGVERLTVYRHFATEGEIFQACSTRYDELHPLPDGVAWQAIVDPFDRLTTGLTDLYSYFADTERMTSAVLRDAPSTPSMHEPFARYQRCFHAMNTLLVAGFIDAGIPAERVQLPIRLAVDFPTWQIMVRERGMSVLAAVNYQVGVVRWAAIGV